jgi:Spy/CpxP family protein refolding chaperone
MITRTNAASLSLLLLFAAAAGAQGHNPYSGQQERPIKALSESETRQFLEGAGMGYARTAELNRFPGPMHVLELADELALTPEQRARTAALMNAHKAEARAIGAKRVESERVIERLFQSGTVDEAALARNVREAADLEGAYRLSHLETHRRMRALLSEEQIERYVRLRGYAPDGEHRQRH